MQKKIIRSYKKSAQTSFNSATVFISLISSKLDISNLLSTIEDHERSQPSLKAMAGEANNPRMMLAGQGLFLCYATSRGSSDRRERNPLKRTELAQPRDRNKKVNSSRRGGSKACDFQNPPSEDHEMILL